MTTADQQARRLTMVEAAKTLARDATAAARDSEAGTSRWRYFHGVETAAQHVLHPEMASVREGTPWLDAERPAFREGFLEASTRLAIASTSPEPTLRVRLPEPPERLTAPES